MSDILLLCTEEEIQSFRNSPSQIPEEAKGREIKVCTSKDAIPECIGRVYTLSKVGRRTISTVPDIVLYTGNLRRYSRNSEEKGVWHCPEGIEKLIQGYRLIPFRVSLDSVTS